MKLKVIAFFALLVGVIGQFNVYSQVALAATNSKDAVCEGVLGATGSSAGADPCAEDAVKVSGAVQTAIRLFQVFVGLISVFYLIYGGLKFITSTGSSDGVKAGKNTIIYSAIGLVVVMIAEGIVQFVLKRFQ